MQLKRFYIFIITLSLLVSNDITPDDSSQSQEGKKQWSLFKKKNKSSDIDVVEEKIEEEIEENTEKVPEENSKVDKKQKKKEDKKRKKEEKKKKKEEKKKKKKEDSNKKKKGLFSFLKKKSKDEESSDSNESENEVSSNPENTDEDEEDTVSIGSSNIEEPSADSTKTVSGASEDELIQAIIEQNKKIDLLIEHLDPSGFISEEESNQEDSTDMLELLQIVQNKFHEIDDIVSRSDSLFITIEGEMRNLHDKIESINIRLETKIQSIEMSASISQDELNEKIDSLEKNFSSGGTGIQELKDMNKDLILKMLKIDDKYSSEIIRLENKIIKLEDGVSNLKEINKDLVVNALANPKNNNTTSVINSPKKNSSKVSRAMYKKKYDEAYLAYIDSNYKRSLSIFQELLNLDDINDLTDNCQYWMGEIYYSMKDYVQAIDAFNDVFNYKDNNKGAYAYYKLGLSYLNIGDTNKAVQSFRKVISDYNDQIDLVKKSEQFISKYSK